MGATDVLAVMTFNVSTLLLIAIISTAVWTDLTRYRIPNMLTFGAVLLGLGLQTWAFGFSGLLSGLGGLAVGLFLFLPFHLMKGMGAGDVKLMAGIGAFLGPTDTLLAGGLSLLAGSILAFIILFMRRSGIKTLRRYGLMIRSIAHGLPSYVKPESGEVATERFPYAVAIAVGTIAALWWLAQLERLLWMVDWL